MIKPSGFLPRYPRSPLGEWDLLWHVARRVVLKHHEDKTACKELEPGDVLAVSRCGNLFEHYGVYIGQLQVICFKGEGSDSFRVSQVSLAHFMKGREFRIIDFPKEAPISGYHLYSAEETVERAKFCLGREGFDFLGNNCEHFAYWCKTGLKTSKQVDALKNIGKPRFVMPIVLY